jgi:CheY-like chemotaxis protein/KaiC/GvpD/RAD55 family RecA-like ATPase
MDLQTRNPILSGIQPIDRLMGGLDDGQLYLVHGEASGKSLSGTMFLIEGLKRGEHGVLVVNCSPEVAVRRFARVGYDCLEDVISGRLVILEFSNDLVEQIARPGQLTPALREIQWLLGETRPRRLVFDPVTSVVAGDRSQLEARVAEFAQWTKSLGATALLIGHPGDAEVTHLFKPRVAESFCFEMRQAADRATQFIVFEKALTLPDQPIEIDPSRGIFLSDRAQASSVSRTPFFATGPDVRLVDFDALPAKQQEARPISGSKTSTPSARGDYTVGRVNEIAPLELDMEGIEDALARLVENKDQVAEPGPPPSARETSSRLQQGPTGARGEETSTAEFDLASELSGELESVFIPGDLAASQSITRQGGETQPPTTERFEQSSQPTQSADKAWTASASALLDSGPHQGRRAEAAALASEPRTGKRASDIRINAAMTARAVETLLGQEETKRTAFDPPLVGAPAHEPALQESVDPKRFKVLVIDDEAESCEMIVQSLGDFTIEKIHDGVSGLAKLISYKPDLVVLDLDLSVIDGFKLLAHIRARLNVPVIIVSSKLVRSSEGLPAPEPAVETDAGVSQLSKALAASGYYHLTTEFSTKELTQKARQLIARYRGIDSWITSLSARSSEPQSPTTSCDSAPEAQPSTAEAYDDGFTPYDQFVLEVEKRVKAVIDNGSALSIVGCRVPMITAHSDKAQSRLRDVVRGVVRDTDLASTSMPGDVVILLVDARASGARAFAIRLRETVAQKLNQEPSVWMRSFPGLEEASQATVLSASQTNGARYRRRATD